MTVRKSRAASADSRRRFRNELRVNRLLTQNRPPVRTPQLLNFNIQRRELCFESILGETIGPKYPSQLGAHTIDSIIGLVVELERYNPTRRWFRRIDINGRFRMAHRAGLLTTSQLGTLEALVADSLIPMRFAHGDLTARNVMQDDAGLVLIDWEWAGLYPTDYDLAFLWFSLLGVDGGRDRVERGVRGSNTSFLLSALLIQLWHLQWFVTPEFRASHVATRDHLLARLSTL